MSVTTKERPILFSAPMVKALLAGTKTQTRRTIKDRDVVTLDDGSVHIRFHGARMAFPAGGEDCNEISRSDSPYGGVGDRLWVKETFMAFARTPSVAYMDSTQTVEGYLPGGYGYRADLDACGQVPVTENGETVLRTPKGNWRPSIFMPRAASRITLEITDVRVQRLTEIDASDAIAEGFDSVESFKSLWTEINGVESWERNDWVWVLGFRRMSK
jgi:hypothetical protein